MNSTSNFDWILSLLAFIVSLIGGVIVRDRQVMHAINSGDSKLHERMDKVREEYVRKDDLDSYMKAFSMSMDRMHETQNETSKQIQNGHNQINTRIDAMLSQFIDRN